MNTAEFKNKFVQRFLGWEAEDPCKFGFNSQEELLNNNFIKSFLELEDFYRFSINKRFNRITLMLELKNGEEYFILGYLKNLECINLPEWKINTKLKGDG